MVDVPISVKCLEGWCSVPATLATGSWRMADYVKVNSSKCSVCLIVKSTTATVRNGRGFGVMLRTWSDLLSAAIDGAKQIEGQLTCS